MIIFFKRLQKTGGLAIKIGRICQVFYQIEKIIKVRIRAEELNSIKARLLENNDRKTLQDD